MVLLTRLYPAPFLNGTLKKSSYGSQTTDYTYNLANMLTEVNNANDSTQISKYTYTYYVDGNQKSKTESVAGTNKGTTNYTYDGLNRLVSEQAPNKTYTYQYDSYGNRSSLSVTGDETYTTSYTYDKNNRMRNQTKTAGTAKEITDFWYDPNGNQISSMTVSTGGTGTAGVGIALVGADNTNSYSEYNSWNQLIKTMQNGKTSSYTYNGDGLRMSKTVNGVKTSHIWDGTNIAADVSGSTVTKYIRGLQLISSKKGSNENFYTYNGHGDVVQLTNSNGDITKQYSYDAFGVEIDKADNDTNPFRYCGEYYDTEIDSVYLRARYYRPTIGRFITEDPIMDGLNWYSYCDNNSVNVSDPSGLYGEEWALPWVRQQRIWMPGVYALQALGLSVSAEMLHHALRWRSADDVYIKDEWNGVEVTGSDRINGNHVVYALRNNFNINNEIDWQKSCAQKEGRNTFYWSGVLALNATTDVYLSFNNATVTIDGYKNANGSWITRVNVYDVYDFDVEKFENINSFKTAVGGAAGTAAALEQIPLIGSIKSYEIHVEFLTER